MRDGCSPSPLEEVVVVAPYGAGVDPDLVPANVQRATAEQLQRSQALDLTDFLNRQFSSVSINHAQNNPLQPDFNFRGFTASPLLGLPQGIAVYQNGVRINEPFGDTINWDLVPLSAIERRAVARRRAARVRPEYARRRAVAADEERLQRIENDQVEVVRRVVRAARSVDSVRRQQRPLGLLRRRRLL